MKTKRELESFTIVSSDITGFEVGDKFTIAGQYKKVSLMQVLFDFISAALGIGFTFFAGLLAVLAIMVFAVGVVVGVTAGKLAKLLDA